MNLLTSMDEPTIVKKKRAPSKKQIDKNVDALEEVSNKEKEVVKKVKKEKVEKEKVEKEKVEKEKVEKEVVNKDKEVVKEVVNKKEEVEETDEKKRGRKPRGGKLILRETLVDTNFQPINNVILHLKCSLKDLEDHNNSMNKMLKDPLLYDPNVPPEIMTYDTMPSQSFSLYETEKNTTTTEGIAYAGLCKRCSDPVHSTGSVKEEVVKEKEESTSTGKEEVVNKIRSLKIAYYKGDINKRSSCFWCTYDFENKPCYIPRQELVDTLLVYGYFCTPECAAAHLFKENIDDHTKFERYHFINKLYGSASEYKESIKPAPNPFYLLDRFMGTLSIAEYRKMLKTQSHSLITVEKPMTRVLPEIHADNDTAGSTYKIKKAERPAVKK